MMIQSGSIPPVFVVGVGRSGTTLLANLLGSHPMLSPIYETPFVRNLLLLCEYACWFWGHSLSRKIASTFLDFAVQKRFLTLLEKYRRKCEEYRREVLSMPDFDALRAQRIRQTYESFPFKDPMVLFDLDVLITETDRFLKALQEGPLAEDEIFGLARQYLNRLFSMHCERHNKPFWLNKTPRLLLCLNSLSKLYPTAKCIHIVRDGRDVAASNLTLAWGPDTIKAAAARWKGRLVARKRFDPKRLAYMEVHYEDLIRSPAEALRRVCRFATLGSEPVDDIVSRFEIYDQSVGRWRAVLSPRDRTVFAKVAGDLLIELGYEKDYSWVK